MQNYQIEKKAIYEIFDTEVIIINFNTGDYYTLPCLAKQLWQMLEKNASIEMMVTAVVAYYQCDADKAYADISHFFQELEAENLLAKSEWLPCDYDLMNILTADAQYKWEYCPPMLHRYSDIEDLLLLDPIHDVDDSGWPHQAPKSELV